MSKRDPKQLILDAALSVFVETGFERATTEQVRRCAGVSNGALFHHFPSKEALAEALYLRGIAAYQAELLQALDTRRSTDTARAMVNIVVHHHLAWVERNRDLAWFMYERGRPDWQPTHGADVRKLNRATLVRMRDWIAPLAAAGAVRDLPIAVLTACVIGPAHFIARRWVSGLIAAPPTSFTEVLADAAWAALAPGKPRRAAAPSQRLSPAALVEAAALDAVIAAAPAPARDGWTIAQLTLSSVANSVSTPALTPRVQSIALQGDDRLAVVDVDLLNADGDVAKRGHVVCLRSDAPDHEKSGPQQT